jgi:protoheme IX farnesyltransferase
MKATAETIEIPITREKSLGTIVCELIKARLTLLVLLTTLVGFYVGTRGPMNYVLMFHALFGTALLACGASALNQLLERQQDAQMRRTEDRPLPSGRLQPDTVLIFGGLCSALGMIYLAATVNLLTSLLGVLTLVSYLFVYTPLKMVTSFNTAVGAIPGALPPLMGWTAARGEITLEGWTLFAILFFWQLPHFLAIAWIYRDDYARAGYVMLPVVDPEGGRTGRQAVSHTLGLLPISFAPFILGMAGPVYFLGAALLGGIFLWSAIRFARKLATRSARILFFVSILYLPLLLGLMVADKIKH